MVINSKTFETPILLNYTFLQWLSGLHHTLQNIQKVVDNIQSNRKLELTILAKRYK
jgi:hypothetical protein